ncbi:MAG: pyridoxal phosphate-dependent aminotransferase [Atopobiaceae bacterium]|nr:pyridoxal phosphate-dependent aminotransferase [Atopobiaceae bacterium]
MPYDFETRPDRSKDGSSKWNSMYMKKPDVPEGVVPLSVADMEFVTAPEIASALSDLALNHVLGYTAPNDAYYDAVLSWQERRHGWKPEREWIVTTPGVVPAFFAASKIFTKEGEGIIVQPPVYHPFMFAIKNAGRDQVDNPLILEEGLRYRIDFDDLERKAADPKNTLMILCSPHNPIGRVWSAEELRRIADICFANDVFLICDEIHNDLILPGHEHSTLLNVLDESEYGKCMVCTAPSKTFSLAGLQCSNIFIPDSERREAFKAYFASLSMASLNIFAYTACRSAYTQAEGWLEELLLKLDENRRLVESFVEERMPEVGVAPLEGTYLQWIDLRAWGLSTEEQEELMISHDLFFDEGAIFGQGGAGFERINLAAPTSVIREALERLAEARTEALES